MMFDGNNDDVLIIKVPKWISIWYGKQWKQWWNFNYPWECPYYMAKINGSIWKKWWLIHGPENGTIMSSTLMDDMADKHNGMFGQVAKEIN